MTLQFRFPRACTLIVLLCGAFALVPSTARAQFDTASILGTVRDSTAGGYPLVGDVMKAELKLLGIRTEPGKRGPRATDVQRKPGAKITYLTPN